jgi:sortase A
MVTGAAPGWRGKHGEKPMRQGLERLFWVVGGLLLLPFAIQQGLVLDRSAAPTAHAPQLYSAPVAQPAIASPLSPASAAAATEVKYAAEPSLQKPDTSLWSAARIAAWDNLADVVGRPVGRLLIPSLDVEVPVFPESNELAFTLGAGIIPGTGNLETDGNIGVASHRDGHFRHLKNVAIGDLLLVKTANRLRHFRVVETRIVEPSDTWVLDRGDTPAITLVTCYPFHYVGSAPQRYIVSAQEVQSELTSLRPSHTVIGGYYETLKF